MGTVSVKFSGRFGNNLFQYAAARIFASKHGLDLVTDWPREQWLPLSNMVYGVKTLTIPEDIEIGDGNFLEWMLKPLRDVHVARYHFNGYFQFSQVYEAHRDVIRDAFQWPKADAIEESQAVCMHARLTDHGHGRLHLDPMWYVGILEQLKFKTLNIVTDDPFAEGYFEPFKKWRPNIWNSPNAMDDFNMLRSHKTIIIGPSSFAWWAAFMGNATKVFQWKRDQELPYIQYQLKSTPDRLVIPVDGKFLREARP